MKTEVLTLADFKKLYKKLYGDLDYFNLEDKIKYFSYGDLDPFLASEYYLKTLRFIVCYDNKDILGVCKFASWSSSGFSISYLSTNIDHRNHGISKKILEVFFYYFSETYPNETLNLTGYSILGWLCLRKYNLEFSKKYNVKIVEKAIDYITDWSDENRKLFEESREIIKNEYKLENIY
jgi:hypothetical protein